MTAELRILTVTRYGCPCCPRTHSSRQRAMEHLGRCWSNPDAQGCRTCKHFEQDEGDSDVGLAGYEGCAVGVSLAGQPGFELCAEHVDDNNPFGKAEADDCPHCRTDGRAVKPGPIINCALWEANEYADR